MRLRRGRFADVVRRQLDAFEADHADLMRECEAAERAYHHAGREDAEEAYGDYLDRVAVGSEALAEMRDRYAATLDESAAAEYEQEFERAVARRLRRFTAELP